MLAIAFGNGPTMTGAAGLRTMEELRALGIPLLADVPAGDHAGLAEHFGLPPNCVWYVTAREEDARPARDAGLNVILIDPDAALALVPDARGLHTAPRIDDVLEIVRVPYTRSALNVRYIMRTVLSYD